MTTSSVIDNQTLQIPVDAEHGSLRFSVIVIFMVILIATFILFNGAIPSAGFNFLAIFLAFGVTYVLTQIIENWLKKRWPSGRTVQIDARGVRIERRGNVQAEINGALQVNFLAWRFKIKRRTRAPKGWYVVACALEQDGDFLAVYTFMSPAQFEALKLKDHFPVLMGKSELKSREAERDLRLAGQQRRLHVAEHARWMSGAEMTAADFERYLAHLQTHYPKWMPGN